MTETALQTSDFGPTLQAALAQGGEVPLFALSCISRLDGLHITHKSGNPGELLSYRADVTLAKLRNAVKAPVSQCFGTRIAAAKIARLHEDTGARQIPLFTVTITGKVEEDDTISTTEVLTVPENVAGIPGVQKAGELALQNCRDALAHVPDNGRDAEVSL